MVLALLSPAWAAAYTLVDSGVRAQGRAGAFVAGADDISAQWYNPAALDNVARSAVKLDLWAASESASFDREDLLGTNPFAAVTSEAAPVPEPAGGAVFRLGGLHPALAHTTVALGLTVPTGVDYAWPADGPQRYAVVDAQVRQLFVGPSVAQAITPWFVVGASLQYTTLSVKQTFTATLCNVDEPESCGSDNPSDDVGLAVDVADPGRITGNFGVLVRPRPWLTLGASAQPAIAYAAAGTVTSTISDDNSTVRPVLTGSTFADDDATLRVTLPWTVRFGAEARIGARARVEVDGTWTGWSATDALTVTDLDLALETIPDGPLHGESIVVSDDVSLRTGFVDSWSVRIGGDVEVIPALTVRAGVYGESSATPDAMASVAVMDADKAGAALGLTARLGPHLVVDASGSFTGFADRTVTASGYAQTALDVDYQHDFRTTAGAGRLVGNGEYRATAWVAGVGVGWEFGAPGGR